MEPVIDRAIYLLRTVKEFINKNPISDYTVMYDGAMCDGGCLAFDCESAAEELAALRSKEEG